MPTIIKLNISAFVFQLFTYGNITLQNQNRVGPNKSVILGLGVSSSPSNSYFLLQSNPLF